MMFSNLFFNYTTFFRTQYKRFLFKTFTRYLVIRQFFLAPKRDV